MPNPNPNLQKPPLVPPKQPISPDFCSIDDNSNVVYKMQFKLPLLVDNESLTLNDEAQLVDYTSVLSDNLLTRIFSKLSESQHVHTSLVCKRWLYLHGRLVQKLRLCDWDFLDSGRILYRFPNLSYLDLVPACISSPRNSGILVTHKLISFHVDCDMLPVGGFLSNDEFLPSRVVDGGLRIVASGCSNLRKLVLINAGELGLACVAEECDMLQELELHCCSDMSLKGISGCRNLQVLKLIGCLDGFYNSVISDIGLTILAQGCKRLVKLELSGCEGSYAGIKAIGQCCQMLEEFTLCDHRMDGGWLAALSYLEKLKTLRLHSCKSIDTSPGSIVHLGICPTLEELHLQRCQIRDKESAEALFSVCQMVREILLQDCWGLTDDIFKAPTICRFNQLFSLNRRLRVLSLEGCSLLTMEGLDSVIPFWKALTRLRVVSCNNIKNSEVTPAVATLFSVLKELKWRPDSRSLLSSTLADTGIGKKGGRFFKRMVSVG